MVLMSDEYDMGIGVRYMSNIPIQSKHLDSPNRGVEKRNKRQTSTAALLSRHRALEIPFTHPYTVNIEWVS